jgi:hypothetical protein
MPLEDRPRGCPETSVRNYHYTLRNNPEERSSHTLRSWSLKSCSFNNFHISLHLVRTDWWQVSLCFTLLMWRAGILVIRYICIERYFLSFNMYGLPQYLLSHRPSLAYLKDIPRSFSKHQYLSKYRVSHTHTHTHTHTHNNLIDHLISSELL